MVDSDDEDELLVTFAVTSIGCSSCLPPLCWMLQQQHDDENEDTGSMGEQVFAKTGTVLLLLLQK